MAAAPKSRTATAPATATELPPPVANAQAHEALDYLPSGTGLAWLDEQAESHRAAVVEHRKAHRAVQVIAEQTEQMERAHRRAVRDCLVAGQPAPTRDFDPDSRGAALEVAIEDGDVARSELARVACDALLACRAHRADLQPLADQLSRPLLRSLTVGPQAATETARDSLKARLASFDRTPEDDEAVVDVTSPTREEAVRV